MRIQVPMPPKVHDERYIKKHYRKVKRLRRKYWHDSRNAAKALVGEMVVIKSTLRDEIPALCDIDPDDTAKLERNVEAAMAALQSYLDETADPSRGFFRNAIKAMGIVFIALGAMALLSGCLPFGIQPLKEAAIPTGAAFATIGGAIFTVSNG